MQVAGDTRQPTRGGIAVRGESRKRYGRKSECTGDSVEACLRGIALTFYRVTGDVHGRAEGVLQYGRVDMRFVLPGIQDIGVPAAEQRLLVHHPTSRRIDNPGMGFAAGEEGGIA